MRAFMEKIHMLFTKLIDVVFWQSLLAHFHWVDWITTAFVLIGLIYGMRKGLMREMVELIEMVIVVAVTFIFQSMVTNFLFTYLPGIHQRSLASAAFILTALCAWFVVAVIDRYMQKWVHAKISGFVKVTGGALLGAVQFFLIWSFISQAVLLMPLRGTQKIYEQGSSVTGEYVKVFAPALYDKLANRGQRPKAKA